MWDFECAHSVGMVNRAPQKDVAAWHPGQESFRAGETQGRPLPVRAAASMKLQLCCLQAYGGNRAPVTVGVHKPWMSKQHHSKDLGKFMDYALAHPDVWVVTHTQLLDWMADPVPASKVGWGGERLAAWGGKGGRRGDVTGGCAHSEAAAGEEGSGAVGSLSHRR